MIPCKRPWIFTILLITLGVVIFFLTFDCGRVARLIPEKVIIPTMALLMLQLVQDFIPALEKRWGAFEKLRWPEAEKLRDRARTRSEKSLDAPQIRRQGPVLLWILSLPVLIYAVGFLVAVPIYTFVYLRLRAKKTWLAVAMAAGCWGFLYGLFVLALRAPLYAGKIWP